ncbi:Uncharacterised protein [Hafnia alvei]|nr:Uncharacterised protein [Hafnia alvei]
MSLNIYFLRSDVVNYCSFIQSYPAGERSIIGRSMMRAWLPYDSYYPVTLDLRRNDIGKKIISLILVAH